MAPLLGFLPQSLPPSTLCSSPLNTEFHLPANDGQFPQINQVHVYLYFPANIVHLLEHPPLCPPNSTLSQTK